MNEKSEAHFSWRKSAPLFRCARFLIWNRHLSIRNAVVTFIKVRWISLFLSAQLLITNDNGPRRASDVDRNDRSFLPRLIVTSRDVPELISPIESTGSPPFPPPKTFLPHLKEEQRSMSCNSRRIIKLIYIHVYIIKYQPISACNREYFCSRKLSKFYTAPSSCGVITVSRIWGTPISRTNRSNKTIVLRRLRWQSHDITSTFTPPTTATAIIYFPSIHLSNVR